MTRIYVIGSKLRNYRSRGVKSEHIEFYTFGKNVFKHSNSSPQTQFSKVAYHLKALQWYPGWWGTGAKAPLVGFFEGVPKFKKGAKNSMKLFDGSITFFTVPRRSI